MKMKKLFLIFACLWSIHVFASVDDDKSITVNELPVKARSFMQQYFPEIKVSYAVMETDFFSKKYKVIWVNGQKAEFDKNGEWTEVDCKYTVVPDSIVPVPIRKYVREQHPEQKIIKIERDSKEYEVKLNNKLELTFDRLFRLIEIDD